MATGVIVIVDLGHENCQMIKEDVESFGLSAVICSHDVDQVYLDSLGDIKGFIPVSYTHLSTGCQQRPERKPIL